MKTSTYPRSRKQGNPDLRRQHQTPAPSIPQLVKELKDYLQPSLFTPLIPNPVLIPHLFEKL